MAKSFKDLTEAEILALAISNEETDGRIYANFAARLKENYPSTAQVFKEMEAEEDNHRRVLIDEYRRRFGDHIPLIRRQDVRGFVNRRPVWLTQSLGIDTVRRYAESMEAETQRFYERAAARTTDASTRKLLGDLAEAERGHVTMADELQKEHLTDTAKAEEDKAQRRSVSTLAPVFAAAFATKSSHDALLVGLAASFGAGISMGFAEALSDDGSLTGRGKPLLRGIVCGLMTTAGGIGHSLPYLIPNFRTATALAVFIVAIELLVISWIRNRYMDTPFLRAAFQVIVGGVCVFLVGILIGSA